SLHSPSLSCGGRRAGAEQVLSNPGRSVTHRVAGRREGEARGRRLAAPGVNEFSAARSLYRRATFLVTLIVVVLLALQLKWGLLQLCASVIIAAGMAPIVRRATDPTRSHVFGWRPPTALVVIMIYIVVGIFLLVLGSIFLHAAIEGVNTLMASVPQYTTTITN